MRHAFFTGWDRERWHRVAAPLAGRRSLWWLCAALGVLCGLAGLRVILLLVTAVPLPAVTFPATASLATQSYSLYPAAPQPGVDRLAVARIDAVVVGVVSRAEGAWATIALKGKPDAIFTVGDRLANTVVVEDIVPAGVIVREQGELRHIPLRSLVKGGGAAIAAPVAAPVSAAIAAPVNSAEEAARDAVGVIPVINADGSTGFRIGYLDPQLEALGLVSEGDVIRAVNGQPLADLMGNPDAVAALRDEAQLTITLVRDGRQQDVSVDDDLITHPLAQ